MDRGEGCHADRQEEFHVAYSVSGATRLMYRLGFSPQVPARQVAERDEQAVTDGRR
ncbi:winged helix-turn-helix domain-containing protein [Streptomyces sp. NPDC020707]|uniref:winged helix-turn-helix domain-containing protein n=1 Tax=Streptomyces sp. NPDC020707 TaxID=3365084 RepID=UPI00379D025C